MPQINVSDDTHARLKAFGVVVQVVSGDELDDDTVAEVIIDRGIDLMLVELLGQVDANSLLVTIQKLGKRHPAEVFAFIADAWKTGTDIEQQEQTRDRFGFHPPERTDEGESSGG